MSIVKARITCITIKNITKTYLAGSQRGQGGIVGCYTSHISDRDRGGERHDIINKGILQTIKV